ncbi:MAG: SH3 domain-containing protein [Lachnospiraceae bacterium]|nr:SH3 domain-containing protein [Lachnospiraceae bacterium]
MKPKANFPPNPKIFSPNASANAGANASANAGPNASANANAGAVLVRLVLTLALTLTLMLAFTLNVWASGTHTVTFFHGYTPNPGNIVISVADGETVGTRFPADPERDGFYFHGWLYNPGTGIEPFDADTVVTSDISVQAEWGAVLYDIFYDLDGGTVNPLTPNPVQFSIYGSFMDHQSITLNNPTKQNFTFAGWTGTGLSEPTMSVHIPVGSFGHRWYTATWTAAPPMTFDLDELSAAPDNAAGPSWMISLNNIIITENNVPIILTGDSGGRSVVITYATDITLAAGTKIMSDSTTEPALRLNHEAVVRGDGSDVNIYGHGNHAIGAVNGVTLTGTFGDIGGMGPSGSGIIANNGNITILGQTGNIYGAFNGIITQSGDVTIAGRTERIQGTINGIRAGAGDITISGTTGAISGGDSGGGLVATLGVTISGTTGSIYGGLGGINSDSGGVLISGTTGAINGGTDGKGIAVRSGDVIISGNGTTGQIGGGDGGIYSVYGDLVLKDSRVVYASSVWTWDSSISGEVPSFPAPGSQGILLSHNECTVYGNVTLKHSLTIGEYQTLTIPQGSVLTIPNWITLTNNGTIINHGVIESRIGGFGGSGTLIGTPVRYRSNVPNTAAQAEVAEQPDPPTPAKSLYTVNATFLNERSGPGTHFPLVGRLARGTVVEIIEFSPDGDWVLAHTGTWLSLMYLNHLSGPVRPLETEASPGRVMAYAVNISPASRLFVRNAPGMNGRIVGTLRAGDIVRVTGLSNGWATINYTSGIPTAYVSAQYLRQN